MSHPPPAQPTMPFSGLVLTLGIAALLIGTLIATFSTNGRTPGLVILGIGAALTVPSYLLVRRAWNRTVYRVTRRRSPGLLLAAIGVTAAIVAGAYLFVIVLDEVLGVRVPAVALIVPGGLLVLRYYLEMRTALQVNARGVKLGGVPTLWRSVDRLVLSKGAAAVTIEVRRRADAPAQDHEPVPVEIPARKVVPADLVTAVRRFGPADVRVVRRQGTAEQQLSP
ncbi:hypothetical protein [Spirillospora sp. NPDC048819]|uniref:hypothetical protein n=1 Tax=Spirillospora sp. NPDC048819 TaxID=3155268 RepID=UPI0033EABD77